MSKLLMLFTAIGAIITYFMMASQSVPPMIESKLGAFPPEVISEFIEFKIKYGKFYENEDIEVYRLNVFYDNYKTIKAHDPSTGWTMAINQFADMPTDEFAATLLGYKSDPNRVRNYEGIEKLPQAPPSSWNWTAQGDVTPVKNQGSCGDCYAFSATGSLESDSAIFGTGLQSFSEQQLCDCSTKYGNNGCNGGLMDYCFKYVIANGITTEAAYPYTGVQGTCKINGGAFKITTYTDIPANNCTALLSAVYQQPTSVAVAAQTWQFYSTGIFSMCGNQVDHGVLAVGYAPTYWIVKNSWGTTWGQAGYIQLKNGNTCAICSEASYPVLK